jgi:hypothetical protein
VVVEVVAELLIMEDLVVVVEVQEVIDLLVMDLLLYKDQHKN